MTKTVDLSKLTEAQKQALLADMKRVERAEKFNRLSLYKPRAFQETFHAAGRDRRFRMLMAPNRPGKTYSAAMELAMHLTGRYPGWWQGRRFRQPTSWWVVGVSFDQMRKSCHALVMGESELGTGAIPAADIAETHAKPGVPGMYSAIRIKHVSGGLSTLDFMAYNQGRAVLQGAALDGVWMDEEPTIEEQNAGIVDELVARIRDRQGILMITYTPLHGETPLTREYYPTPTDPLTHQPDTRLRHLTQIGLREIPEMAHMVDDIKREHPRPHEWRARIDGLPALGEGAIFPFTEDVYVTPLVPLPAHTRYIFGLDYGINHPTAAVLLAWVEDIDTTYVVHEFREEGVLPPIAAAWMNGLIKGAPCAWPHDMSSREKGSGKTGQLYYKELGINMLPMHAQYPDERKNKLEDSIDDIRSRMASGKFKIFPHCTKLIGEIATYHRRNHKPVDIKDDLIAATRYAHMMLRFSRTTNLIGRRQAEKEGREGAAEAPFLDAWWLPPRQKPVDKVRGQPVLWSSDWHQRRPDVNHDERPYDPWERS